MVDGEDVVDRALSAVGELGLDPTDDMGEQMEVFRAALEVYAERETTYGSAWKDAELREFVSDLDKKARRIERGLQKLELPASVTNEEHRQKVRDSMMDSCVDIANYAAFIARRLA